MYIVKQYKDKNNYNNNKINNEKDIKNIKPKKINNNYKIIKNNYI